MYRQSADRGLLLAGRGRYGTTGQSTVCLLLCATEVADQCVYGQSGSFDALLVAHRRRDDEEHIAAAAGAKSDCLYGGDYSIAIPRLFSTPRSAIEADIGLADRAENTVQQEWPCLRCP